MNKMKEVARLLGVELGEKFKIEGYDYESFKLSYNDGLICVDYTLDEDEHLLTKLLTGKIEIIKPILDEQEKEYLEGVLEPFKRKVEFVCKARALDETKCFIHIQLNRREHIQLPRFSKDMMYKGMEIDKHYALEELELFDE